MRIWPFVLMIFMTSCSSPSLSGARFAPCPGSPNCVNSKTPDQNITAFPGGDLVWARLRTSIVCLGGTIIEEDADYLHATFSSKVFGFVDDLECQKYSDLIHVRSAARTGWWDFGVNRRRVEALREMLTREAGCK